MQDDLEFALLKIVGHLPCFVPCETGGAELYEMNASLRLPAIDVVPVVMDTVLPPDLGLIQFDDLQDFGSAASISASTPCETFQLADDHWPQICHLVDSANAMPDQDMRGKVWTIATIIKSGGSCKRIQMCRKHDGVMHHRMLSACKDARTIAPHVLDVIERIFGA